MMNERVITIEIKAGSEMVLDITKVSAVLYNYNGQGDQILVDGHLFALGRTEANNVDNALTAYWGNHI